MPFICSLLSTPHTHIHFVCDRMCVFFSLLLSFSSFWLRVFATTANVTASILWHSRAFHFFCLPLPLLLVLCADSLSLLLTQFPSLPTYLYVIHTIPSFFFALLFAHFRKIFNYKATINYWKRNSTEQTSANTDTHRAKQKAFLQCDHGRNSDSSSKQKQHILFRYRHIRNSATTRTMLTTSTTIKMDLCARALMLHCMLTSYRL